MIIGFYKYHGTGNDFILIDNRLNDFPVKTNLIRHLCDRHYGIGADGLILLSYKTGYDFEMNYYNSDGNIGSMCANGGRCAVAFASKLKIIEHETDFFAFDGSHNAQIIKQTDNFVDVVLSMKDVKNIENFDNDFIINTGSPHYIKFVENLSVLNVYDEGQRIRYNKPFTSEGINVNFVEVNKETLFVRTYERGVENETLSCGTGVIAAALAYAYRERESGFVNIKTRGGDLKVGFINNNDSFSNISIEGPANFVFKGETEINF